MISTVVHSPLVNEFKGMEIVTIFILFNLIRRNTMKDLKARIKEILDELIQEHLYSSWPEHLVASGIDENEARNWGVEISQVVDEYRSTLLRLADLLDESDSEQIPLKVHSWAVGISEVTVPEIEEPMRYLEGLLKKYLPPEPDDEDESP
jgi:hypothetical protein